MKILQQIIFIFAVCFFGEIVSIFLPVAVPSSIVSMIILFLLLISNTVKIKQIKEISEFLQKNMAVFFIPPSISIINNTEFLKGTIHIIVFICFITFVLTFAVTAYTVKLVIFIQNKIGENKNA